VTAAIGALSAGHGLTAVYVFKHLSKIEQAELRVRLGARRPADLELLARHRRRESRR
jgi:UDP-glucose 4-epimerase